MEPIVIKTREATGYRDAEEVWTYERIVDTWGEDSDDLVPQLARRCKQLQAEVERLKEENKKLNRQLTLAEVAYLNTDAGMEGE